MTHISQILISDEAITELPPLLDRAVKSVSSHIEHTQHTLFLKEPLRIWIAQNYGEEILKAFDKLKPYAYKADLARYLLLFKLGGWYVDMGIRILSPVSHIPDDIDLIAFSDLSCHTEVSFACYNGIIYAKAGSLILADTIADICRHVEQEYYGRTMLYPTGPVCFGKNVAQHGMNLNMVIGTFMPLTPNYPKHNRAFVFNDGTIFALHKEGQGGDFASLGVHGTNHYGKMYQARDVYDTSIHVCSDLCIQSIR